MHCFHHAAAILLSASACVGEADEDGTDAAPGDDVRASIHASLAMPEEHEDICELLPSEGPCSLLCDYDALVAQYVPPHTCVVFRCLLTNGKYVSAHACHPPD